MGIDNGIGSETMGAFARLDATLTLRDLTRGRIFWRENGRGWRPRRRECFLVLLHIRNVSALVEPGLFSPPNTFFESQPSPLLHRLFH